MEISEKRMVKEIRQGRNRKGHLANFQKEFTRNYYENALILSAYRYYTLCETILDAGHSGQISKCNGLDGVLAAIKASASLLCCGNREKNALLEARGKLRETREKVMEKMQILTSYVDTLNIYEYVLNRMELHYKEAEPMDETVFVNRVVTYIFSIHDNVVINENIKEVLGQLPVRMTKNKYYELLRNSISIYKDGDRSALDGYLYMLRTSAMLYQEETGVPYFPEFRDFIRKCKQTDWLSLTESHYMELSQELPEIAAELMEKMNTYMAGQELLNSFYVCVEAIQEEGMEKKPESSGKERQIQADESVFHHASAILNRLNQVLEDGETKMPEELDSHLVALEGKQEELQKRIDRLDGLLFELTGMLSDERTETFRRMQKLLSTSLFVDLEEEESKTADSAYVARETERLLDELSLLFHNNPQPVNRAVMANTINKMPVFFNSAEEVSEYIQSSLSLCRDPSEKLVSMKIISDIMEQA